MAIKGLTNPVFGEYNYNGNVVSYSNGFVCGKAVEYSFEPETSDNNPLYGDDNIAENDYGSFNGGTLTLNTTDLDAYTSRRLLKLKEVQVQVGSVQVTELVKDDDAKPVPLGFGIIETHQINDIDKYRAVILCKATPNIPAEAATTKGESIEWQTKEIELAVTRADENSAKYKHQWEREAWFDTHAEAYEYLKTILNVLGQLTVTSQAGSETGNTVISVSPAAASGNTYVYKANAAMPTYKEDLTSWTALTPGEDVTIANRTEICVAEVDSAKKAVAAGTVTVIANEE